MEPLRKLLNVFKYLLGRLVFKSTFENIKDMITWIEDKIYVISQFLYNSVIANKAIGYL